MSSAPTSLRVSKGGGKFAPKAKPRATRRDAGAPKAKQTKPREPQVEDEDLGSVDDEQPEDGSTHDSGIPVVGPSRAREADGIPAVAPRTQPPTQTLQQRRPSVARAGGTPIVIGVPSASPQIQPRVASGQGPSAASASAASPQRLASLSSPTSPGSRSRGPLSPLRAPSLGRRSTSGQSIQSPTSKRMRSADGTPEPIQLPRLKTVDDYPVLPADEINNLPIAYFCRDYRHGKPTQDFIDRENEALRKLHESAAERSAGKGGRGPKETPATPTSAASRASDEAPPASAGQSSFPTVRVRIGDDGKVIIDSGSREANRHDMADTEEPLEIVDESARPRYTNSLSYVKLRTSRKRWDPEETSEFYAKLREFGSDFEMIAANMPDRNRYDIRNKFKLEERRNGHRITDALLYRPPAQPKPTEDEPTEDEPTEHEPTEHEPTEHEPTEDQPSSPGRGLSTSQDED
ncbi:hypothetical protein GGF46_000663 [Coemansia sp. RSA 552]|nr:hypothetical protein GGF46_000663 [Coemansia sp. RSA 552]